MRQSSIPTIVVMLGLLFVPGYGAALQITPGKWKLTTTATNPTSPQPQTEVRYQCMAEAEMSPEGFMNDVQGCTTSNVVSTDETLKWDMGCDMEEAQATGQAEFNSTGVSANGRMRITMVFNGQQMHFERSWEGQRVGPCD